FQVKLSKLLGIDGRRGPGHEVERVRRLGKCDDLANRRLASEDRHNAIHAQRNAAVRRRTVLERFEEEAETELRLLVRDAEAFEDLRLQPGIVNSDRPAADL